MQSEPIRVLHMIASLNIGGSQSMIMNLYRKIDRNKIQFDFIIDHADETEYKDEVESLGGKVYVLPSFHGWNIWEIIKAWNGFFDMHKEYSILHTHSRSYASIYLPIARKHGLITISHAHSTSNGKGISALIKDVMQYPIRNQSDYMFACSKQAGIWLFGKKAIQRGCFKIIPNAIDAKSFRFDRNKRLEVRKNLGINNEFVVGHVGRMMPPKNHEFLLRCFAEFAKRIPESKLLLVGDGDLKSYLQNKAKQLGITDRTLFVGSRINISDYYQAMDFFVFPSLWEGLGMAIIEAEAAGLPCIVSDTVPESVDIGAGLVQFCTVNSSPYDWAKKIKPSMRVDTLPFILKAGFDVCENAHQLQLFYEEIGIEKNIY